MDEIKAKSHEQIVEEAY